MCSFRCKKHCASHATKRVEEPIRPADLKEAEYLLSKDENGLFYPSLKNLDVGLAAESHMFDSFQYFVGHGESDWKGQPSQS